MISAVPRALKRFLRAMRMWISAVWLSGCLAAMRSPKAFETPHLGLDPASGMVSSRALPECPAIVPVGAQGFVSGDRGWAVLFPRQPILTNWDDRSALLVDDGRVAAAGVVGAIGGYSADLFSFRDLVQQPRQDRTIASAAGGEFHDADVRSGRLHS